MNFPKTAGNDPNPNIVKGVAEDCGVAGSPVNGNNQCPETIPQLG